MTATTRHTESPANASTPLHDDRPLGHERWWGAAAGILLALVDTAMLSGFGITFAMNGRDVTLLVAAFFASSLALFGYLVGALVEARRRDRKNAPHLAIVGIGINLNHRPEDFSKELRAHAASLAMVLDRQVDRQRFAIALLRNLDRTYLETFGS